MKLHVNDELAVKILKAARDGQTAMLSMIVGEEVIAFHFAITCLQTATRQHGPDPLYGTKHTVTLDLQQLQYVR